MLPNTVTAIVRFCTRFPWFIIVLGLAAATISGAYAATHFAINTDINKLISPTLDWRQREMEFEKAFPGHFGSTLVVIDAPTAELASLASIALTQKLKAQPGLFRSVENVSESEFFARNGLLFRPTNDVVQLTQGLWKSRPARQHTRWRPQPARSHQSSVAGFHRRAKPHDNPRCNDAPDVVGGCNFGRCPRRQARDFFVVGNVERSASERERFASDCRGPSSPQLFCSGAWQTLQRCHSTGRRGAQSCIEISSAYAADRLGTDGR